MATPVADSIPLTGNALSDGLLQGGAWQFGGNLHQLTYSFSLNDTLVVPWTPTLANAFVQALGAWSNVANITFIESGSGGVFTQSSADIAATLTGNELQTKLGAVSLGIVPDPAFADLVLSGTDYTRASYPQPEGDVFFDNYYSAFNNVAPGGLGYEFFVHEIGHALGLKHPHDDGGNGRPTFISLGIGDLDNASYTVMSYNHPGGVSASTPMPLDILAIQQIYGANLSYHTGNDTYQLLSYGNTIWDAGGTDTLDASNTFGATIDLRPGHFSSPTFNPATVTAIAYGVTIENAIGGAGSDTITGNDADNNLEGGAGEDTLRGGGGNDTYFVDNINDVAVENANEGTDTVNSSVAYTLGANVEKLTLIGAAAINGTGNALSNYLTGNASNNTLIGDAGDDVLDGGAGIDLMQGGTGDDIYFVDSAVVIPGTYLSISNWGGGSSYFFTPATGSFTLSASDDGLDGDTLVDTVTLYYSEPASGGHVFSVYVSTRMLDMPLAPGTYTDAMRYPFESSGHPGLWVAGDGSGANTSTGSFTVTAGDFTYGGSTPQISQFVVNFTYSGDGGPTVTGTLSVNGPGDVQTDTVVELPNEGTDTVRSLITAALPANVEILELIGSNSINGTGNELNNVLIGNDLSNTLTGLAGNDTIDGGIGTDAAVYSGLRSQYAITLQADGSLIVADQRSGTPDGTDTVSNVELFQFTDGTYTAGSESPVGKTANLLVYDWKVHTLLDGVSIGDGSHNGTTDANGSTSFTGITSTSLTLTASRSIPAEATLTSQAVNLQDAIAILKMIVGLDVNGAGHALSPYQSLAADYNTNGTVGLTDAIDVLKHVVGLPAPDPAWRFVNEIDATIPGKVGLSPGTLPTTISADVSGAAAQVHVGLVGLLNGDVDGNFAGAPGSQDLDLLQPNYFVDLTSHYGLQLSQFGVYA